LSAAVARLRSTGSPSVRALFALLRHPASPLGPDLVLTFLANKDAVIRLEAFRLLLGEDGAAPQFPRLLGKALADPDPEVVSLGIERAAAVGGQASVRALAGFLESWLAGGLSPELGRKTTFALAGLSGPEGRDALTRMLSSRKMTLKVGAVRRSMVVEAGLLRIGDDEAVAAVRSFRRSPAGWHSMHLPDDSEARA
jgi:HEAT repeat protein